MSELVFFRRGEEVLRIGLKHQRLVLDCGEDSDVVIPDPQVSRRHVALHHHGDRCWLEDLSGQGTLVAGQPMMQGELRDGVDLRLGAWSALFRQRVSGGEEDSTQRGPRTDVQSSQSLEKELAPAQVRVKQGSTEFLYPIGADSFTVGKDSANALVISDRFLSGQHLRSIPNKLAVLTVFLVCCGVSFWSFFLISHPPPLSPPLRGPSVG